MASYLLAVIGFLLLISSCAALPGGRGGPGGVSGSVCGSTAASRTAKISVLGSNRLITSNGCPGYPWKEAGVTLFNTTQTNYSMKIPLNPILSSRKTYVGLTGCKFGPIGFALNGMPFYSPCDAIKRDAVKFEGQTFDQCGGHPTPMGTYHYHVLPFNSNSQKINASRNNAFTLCRYSFWRNTPGQHSPLVGFMADGIPIYGPLGRGGRIPTDLDECNGHAGDTLGFYHYHGTSNAPYLVNCLKGCVSATNWPSLGSTTCARAAAQYNYHGLAQVTSK